MRTKHTYDAERGMYVQQIRTITGEWVDYITLKSQGQLNSAVIAAKCCAGAGNRAGAFRVVHKFMGTTVLADFTDPKYAP